MNGEFFPSNQLSLTPYWHNFVSSAAGTQFFHRWFAVFAVLIFLIFYYIMNLKGPDAKNNFSSKNLKSWFLARRFLLWGFSFQFLLGILTLIHSVPLVLGVLHQLGAFCLLALLIRFHFINGQLSIQKN
jgi:cytochrome c oxidase assembly protein subunit 15